MVVETAIIIAILIIAIYKLFLSSNDVLPFSKKRSDDYLPDYSKNRIVKHYLRERLDELKREKDFYDGYINALVGVAHISDVEDKIKELDAKYEKITEEEEKLNIILNKSER